MRDKDDVERYLESFQPGRALAPVPDCVKRVKDELDMHAVAGARGWAVFALADGRPLDHVAYPSWNAAVRAAKWDRDRYLFAEIPPDGCPSYREAAAILHYARTLHRAGFRIPSPDWEHGQAMSMPLRPADRRLMVRQLASGRPLLPPGFAMSNHPSERRPRLWPTRLSRRRPRARATPRRPWCPRSGPRPSRPSSGPASP